MFLRPLLASLLTMGLLAACGLVPPTPGIPSPTPALTATVTLPPPPAITHTTPQTLRVWLPPRFNPAADALMQARLDSFLATHPGLKLEARVKEETGPASLLESLLLASVAAPAALPDLVALPRADLEKAAPAGVLQPIDEFVTDDPNLAFSARALGHVQNTAYGFPFALDALILVSSAREPVTGWPDVVQSGPLAFNANDASFVLALYLAAGGTLTDGQEKPFLDEAVLARVLTLFAQKSVVPVDSDGLAWQSLEGEQGGFAVGWVNSQVGRGQPGVRLEALPGLDESPATLVDGWVWAVASLDVERQPLAIELAQWLTAEEFVLMWNEAAGYLPPRVDTKWDAVLKGARVMPAGEPVALIEPLLLQAVRDVLDGASPETAARTAVEQLK